jgi:hypothetical protein
VDRGALAVSLLGSWLLFAWRDRWVMASPWTAHVPVLATMTFLVLAAAVASGRLGMLPLLVVFGSFMAQTHLALAPLVIALSACALASAFIVRRREGRRSSPIVNACAWLFALLWLMPVAEQLSHDPGNLTRLWTFFVTDTQPRQLASTAFPAWSYALAGVLRPDLYTPSGGHVQLTHLGWGVPLAIAEVLVLPIIALMAFRAGRRFEGSMALMAVVASLVGFWSITRIRGDILDHEIYWIVGLGAINLGIVAAVALRRARRRWGTARTLDRRIVAATCMVLLLASVRVGIRDFNRLVGFESSSRRDDAALNATYDSIRGYLVARQVRKPLFQIDGIWDVAAATFVRLEQDGIPFAVDDDWVPMFTDAFRAHGDEDAIVTIGEGDHHRELSARADNVVVLERHPIYVDALRIGR